MTLSLTLTPATNPNPSKQDRRKIRALNEENGKRDKTEIVKMSNYQFRDLKIVF